MQTTIDEIAPDVFRLSTFVPEVAAPAGFSFNQFLVRDEQPFLYHTGMRGIFPLVSEAVSRLIELPTLRWISFAHVEADECGAMNAFLGVAPHAEVVHGAIACGVSLEDLADRPPVVIEDGGTIDTGNHRMRFFETPHVPHSWESGLWMDDTTGTMFVGDLFSHVGDVPAITTDDIVPAAVAAEREFHSMAGGPLLATTLARLAAERPTTLAVMHGSSFRGETFDMFGRLAHGLEPAAVAP